MADDRPDAANPFGTPPPGQQPPPGPGAGQPPAPPPGWGPPPGPPPGWGPPPGEQPGWGPPAGYGPPPGYGAPGAYYGPRETEPLAIIGFCLAIASWVVCPLVLSVPAAVLAPRAQRYIDQSGGRKEGTGFVTATKWIAWVNIALSLLVILGIVALVVAGVAFESSEGGVEEVGTTF